MNNYQAASNTIRELGVKFSALIDLAAELEKFGSIEEIGQQLNLKLESLSSSADEAEARLAGRLKAIREAETQAKEVLRRAEQSREEIIQAANASASKLSSAAQEVVNQLTRQKESLENQIKSEEESLKELQYRVKQSQEELAAWEEKTRSVKRQLADLVKE